MNGDKKTPYFCVSLLKLSAMSLFTLGIYEFYWFYKNWTFIKERENTGISPFWRASFAFFFCYPCFSRIYAQAKTLHLVESSSAGILTVGWIMMLITVGLPGAFWLLSLFSFIFILPVQSLANRINLEMAPSHNPNQRFTSLNLVSIAVGGLVTLLSIVATFMPQ
jgi:hypothetical protein